MASNTESAVLTVKQRRILILSTVVALALKLYLALVSPTTADSNAFLEFYNHIHDVGPQDIYRFRGSLNNIFNFPPFMIHIISALGTLSMVTGLPFHFWLRAVPSIADVGSFMIVWRSMHRIPIQPQKQVFRLLLLLALCPISVFVNGYEGNVDGLMISFVLLSIFFIDGSRKARLVAGMFFGLAISVKFVPLMFLPAMVLYLPVTRARIEYVLTAASTFFTLSLPFILLNPLLIAEALSGYGSIYGVWGITNAVVNIFGPPQFAHYPYEPIGHHALLSSVLKYVALGSICLVSFLMNYRRKLPLIQQCALITSVFLFLTPGFGLQYLVWLVPFIPTIGFIPTVTYYATATIYIGVVGDTPGGLAPLLTMYACWLSTLIPLTKLKDLLQSSRGSVIPEIEDMGGR